MHNLSWIVSLSLTLATLSAFPYGQSSPPRPKADVLARGKYIVDRVSMCGDCHTPRGEKGEPVAEKYLQGADLGVEPTIPIPGFARLAPDITAKALTRWSAEDLAKAFEVGKRPNGEPFRPPMPGYRMDRKDAEAVAVYLKSLEPGSSK